MDRVDALSNDLIVHILISVSFVSVVVGLISARIGERAGGYWVLGWAALLSTGAFDIAHDAGLGWAGQLTFVCDAFFAPLMLMGALELDSKRAAAPSWPLWVGAIAAVLRVGFGTAELSVGLALHGLLVAPVLFALAGRAMLEPECACRFRLPIAGLFLAMVGVEVIDAWKDWWLGTNQVPWSLLVFVCVPLSALQIASRLMALGAGISSARAATDAVSRNLDIERGRFEIVFEQVREIVAELAPDSRILFVNGRVRELVGLDPEAMVGRFALDFVPAAHRFEAEETWREQLKEGSRKETVLFSTRGADGAPLHLEITVTDYALMDEQRLLVIARDVTDRIAIEEDRKAQNRLLEERVAERTEQLEATLRRLRDQDRLAAVGTLAAGIAHQINNPVGAISAAAEFALLAQDDADARTTQLDALERILEESRRAGDIVRSVLRFAREGSTPKTIGEIAPVLRRSVDLVRPYAAQRGGRIQVDCAPDPMAVRMSPIEIEQMFVNLLRNAVESLEHGVQIKVRARVERDDVVVEIEDDGRGIAEGDRVSVFDPFFTTRLREGGSGLGLSVVHGVVLDHGGSIDLDTPADPVRSGPPERGTRVRIRLPAVGAR